MGPDTCEREVPCYIAWICYTFASTEVKRVKTLSSRIFLALPRMIDCRRVRRAKCRPKVDFYHENGLLSG